MANQKTDTKKPNVVLYVLIGVVVIVAGYFIYTMINDKKPIEHKVNTEKVDKQKESQDPLFKKQGELDFVSSKDKKVIKKIDIEIADNDAKRQRGLMFRKTMEDAQGMLFVFVVSEQQSFWMKNTILPLDIIYINSQAEVVSIQKNAVPYSEKSLPSFKPAQYVVEVNAGYTDKYGIKEGTSIAWTRD